VVKVHLGEFRVGGRSGRLIDPNDACSKIETSEQRTTCFDSSGAYAGPAACFRSHLGNGRCGQTHFVPSIGCEYHLVVGPSEPARAAAGSLFRRGRHPHDQGKPLSFRIIRGQGVK
jgi:hypothetical protein